MKDRLYGKIALLMAAIVLVCAGITAATGVRRPGKGGWRVTASFYPVYIAALQVTSGVEEVALSVMAQPQAGCLHDYQMTPEDMIVLQGTDLLLLNGAGAENFLSNVLAGMPNLPTADLSAGIPLLESEHAHHHHEGETAEEHEEHADYNEHVWVSPAHYRRQVENLRDILCREDPGHAEAYQRNAAAYLEAIDRVGGELTAAAQALPVRECIVFHDSLAYLAEYLGLRVVASLTVGEEEGVTAADLAAAQQAAQAPGGVLLLYDSQYGNGGYGYLEKSEGVKAILTIDTAAAGETDGDAWLDAMHANAEQLRRAAEGG